MKEIVLGLGSNQGDRLGSLRKAIQLLKRGFAPGSFRIIAISPLYESDALLLPDAPAGWDQPHLNLAVLAQTSLEPLALLRQIKSFETQLGRKPRGRWAPREIDIDILAMGTLILNTETLTIPHPRMMERPFAVLPFADLLPNWIHPDPSSSVAGNRQTISGWSKKWRHSQTNEDSLHIQRSTFHLAELVSVINLTPDSFSDGGLHFDSRHAIEHALQISQTSQTFKTSGKILDFGAESTRPHAEIIDPLVEWKRLESTLGGLAEFCTPESPVRISIDTRNPSTARQCIERGVHWLNDVSGFEDPEMKQIARDSAVDLVVMHSLGIPPDNRSRVLNPNDDPIPALLSWGQEKISELMNLGIARERIILDPGIGFGKTPQQAWAIIREVRRLQEWGVRVLVGHSRKSFLAALTPPSSFSTLSPSEESRNRSGSPYHPHIRDPHTLAISTHLASQGVDYIRVHHTEMNESALQSWTQFDGITLCQLPTQKSYDI